ncbi:NADP-dependent malic enzyme [Consotaella salsifontis]|uniref:Malate dehydrogenase (Oxaloacetate-decarboxylating)(NADP+) n=1 Tax=Consotaella salsifontis TaxID=1365950 RepID=A0A1T4P6L9_9HYPH|nr:NADP-dependent malic enzyme [Consotaella salsifontis]SJZ87154.1 malate dehydrogenase (oxaloacetate-decarboxylating)(NADP+) [Consotaella salsifontis]
MTKSEIKPSSAGSDLNEQALFYHRYPVPGKLNIRPSKPVGNQRDLALAYSPGVAAPCLAIAEDPATAAEYTSRANLVAVISNGTAVLGLGDIGPLASKPVMEGKAVLFKKFANIDVFDIEINAPDVETMVEVISSLEPTFGGINLEDIKAPECFEVEKRLVEKMGIPVFHDDQHGTAIIVAAAVRNALMLADKKIEDVKIVASGAGASAIACLNLLVSLGARLENITCCDSKGVIYAGREENLHYSKAVYARETSLRTLPEAMEGADIFLGLSRAGLVKPEMVAKMAPRPLILALANPTPEIMPDEARAVRPDAMICTGRSDFPNQVNNVLCFPFMFRGALDCGATAINEEMKKAAVDAIAALAREEVSESAARAYGSETPVFGPTYLIPSPFDTRLILKIAPAVAKAAADSGVASRPITDFDAYLERLGRFVFRSGLMMKPIFQIANNSGKRVIFSDGEDERVMRAAQTILEESIGHPILIGRPPVIASRLERFGLKIRPGQDFEIINPEDDPRYGAYVDFYLDKVGRKGVTPDQARTVLRTNRTVIGAVALARGDADALLCGLEGGFAAHARDIIQIIGAKEGTRKFAALSALITQQTTKFFLDTYFQRYPDAEDLAEMTVLAARQIRRFGLEPKAALLSHSNFGSDDLEDTRKLRDALALIRERDPGLEIDGEMHGNAALSEQIRKRLLPGTTLSGEANLLVFPSLDAANITMTTVQAITEALHVGPMLLGAAQPAHILSPSVTGRGIVNMATIAIAEAVEAK